jgi:quercetin dioxygenase-like cupin family protein
MEYSILSNEEASAMRIAEDWGSLQWLASREIGNTEGLVLGRVIIKPGQSNPRHRHPNCEEVLYLMRGRMEHTVDDETVILSAGDVITLPPGVFHNAVNIGDDDADMMVVYSAGTREFQLES